MNGSRILLAATLFLAHGANPHLAAAQAPPAEAPRAISIEPDTIAAIAYSPATGTYGFAYNYSDRSEAEAAALAGCKAEDGRIVCWVNEGYCALAVGDDKSVWGVGYVYGKGIGSADAKREAIADCSKRTTNARILLCLSSDGQYIDKHPVRLPAKPSLPSGSTISADLAKKIHQLVKDLEYSEQVASAFVEMVRPWNCEPLGQRLGQAAQDATQKKISADQHSQIEEEVVRQLAQTIRRSIANADTTDRANWKYYDLTFLVKDMKAQCLGYTQVFYVLGSSIGLTCRATDVLGHSTIQIPVGEGHVACVVDLHNGKTVQVDLRTNIANCVSSTFVFGEEYEQTGYYWKLRDQQNRLHIHRRLQLLDRNGLVAAIYTGDGNSHFAANQRDRALSDFTKAIELGPSCAAAYNNRGNAYTAVGQQDKAIADCTKAIEINPEYAEAYSNRGNAYARLGQLEKAVLDYTKAIELSPKYAQAYFNRAAAHHYSRRLPQAIDDYTKAIELNPQYARAYNNRGFAFNESGQRDKALSDYTKAIEFSPQNAEVYNNRGLAYSGSGQRDKAILDYTKAIELKPTYFEAYNNRGNAYDNSGQSEKAILDYTKAIELSPKYAQAYLNRAIACWRSGKSEAAISDYTKVIELSPKYTKAYVGRGLASAKLGRMEDAKRDLHMAIQLSPASKEAIKKMAAEFRLDL